VRTGLVIVALLGLEATALAQQPARRVDVALMTAAEAWDLNGSRQDLLALAGGWDVQVYRGLALRTEAIVSRVQQRWQPATLAGVTVGGRFRRTLRVGRPFVDVAVGLSHATAPVPADGTTFNYLALAGGGVEVAVTSRVSLDLGIRWFHVSNNGREGRRRNPDIQAIGPVVAIGWAY
jgi:hypothetical protein